MTTIFSFTTATPLMGLVPGIGALPCQVPDVYMEAPAVRVAGPGSPERPGARFLANTPTRMAANAPKARTPQSARFKDIKASTS